MTFNHVQSIGYKDRFSSLEDNIKNFLDWSFLHIGGFVNVQIPTSGLGTSTNNTGFHVLKSIADPSQQSRVWESPRKDWIYENSLYMSGNTNINYNNSEPISFSGLYLNNTFLPGPSGSGNYTYTVNYPLGSIVFDRNVSSDSVVKAEYSHRYIQTYKSSEAVWWKEVQQESYSGKLSVKGDYSITSNHRVQLPAIIIELIPRVSMTPYQLGTTENIMTQDLLLHIFTQNPNQRNNIVNTLLLQKDNTFWLYDVSSAVIDKRYPLYGNGSINPSGYNYNTLQEQYKQHWCTIKNSNLSELNTFSTSLYNGIVRWSIEILP